MSFESLNSAMAVCTEVHAAIYMYGKALSQEVSRFRLRTADEAVLKQDKDDVDLTDRKNPVVMAVFGLFCDKKGLDPDDTKSFHAYLAYMGAGVNLLNKVLRDRLDAPASTFSMDDKRYYHAGEAHANHESDNSSGGLWEGPEEVKLHPGSTRPYRQMTVNVGLRAKVKKDRCDLYPIFAEDGITITGYQSVIRSKAVRLQGEFDWVLNVSVSHQQRAAAQLSLWLPHAGGPAQRPVEQGP